jgi:hypothetical protein
MSDTFGSKKDEGKGAEEKKILGEQHVYMRFWLAYTGLLRAVSSVNTDNLLLRRKLKRKTEKREFSCLIHQKKNKKKKKREFSCFLL